VLSHCPSQYTAAEAVANVAWKVGDIIDHDLFGGIIDHDLFDLFGENLEDLCDNNLVIDQK
jgi:hypothetical protein